MNKATKIILIIALCLFVVGLLICLRAFLGSGMKPSAVIPQLDGSIIQGDGEAKHMEKTFNDSGKEIDISLTFAGINVAPSEDGKIHLIYDNTPYANFDSDENSERITLRQNRLNLLTVSPRESVVKLLVPENYRGDIDIETSSGTVKLENLSLLGELDISATSGRISVNSCNLQELSAESTSGSIHIEKATASSSIELDATSGSVSLSDTETNELSLEVKSGSMRLENTKSHKLEAESTSGSLKLDNVDANVLRLSSRSGRISGDIVGSAADYTIYSRTSSGSSNLKDQRGGSRSLDVSTTSGSIHIEFDN